MFNICFWCLLSHRKVRNVIPQKRPVVRWSCPTQAVVAWKSSSRGTAGPAQTGDAAGLTEPRRQLSASGAEMARSSAGWWWWLSLASVTWTALTTTKRELPATDFLMIPTNCKWQSGKGDWKCALWVCRHLQDECPELYCSWFLLHNIGALWFASSRSSFFFFFTLWKCVLHFYFTHILNIFPLLTRHVTRQHGNDVKKIWQLLNQSLHICRHVAVDLMYLFILFIRIHISYLTSCIVIFNHGILYNNVDILFSTLACLCEMLEYDWRLEMYSTVCKLAN